MDSFTRTLFCIYIICLTVNCIDAARSSRSSRSRYSRYSGSYTSGGGDGSPLAGIIVGSIFGVIIILLVIFWTYKICKLRNGCRCECIYNIKSRLRRVRMSKSPEKPKLILRKETIIEDLTNRNLSLADESKNKTTHQGNLSKLTLERQQVSSVQGKTPNVTRNIYSVANIATKAKSAAKRSRSKVSDVNEPVDRIPSVPPPSYEELQYKPVYGTSNAFGQSSKPAYPPPAYDYDFR